MIRKRCLCNGRDCCIQRNAQGLRSSRAHPDMPPRAPTAKQLASCVKYKRKGYYLGMCGTTPGGDHTITTIVVCVFFVGVGELSRQSGPVYQRRAPKNVKKKKKPSEIQPKPSSSTNLTKDHNKESNLLSRLSRHEHTKVPHTYIS